MAQFIKKTSNAQKGFSLLIALVFVGFFGSVLTAFVYSRSGESLRNEATITGWQVAKIARAARIYVRDEFVANPNLRTYLASVGSEDIPVADLVSASLLPNDFARTSGGSAFTALNQEIRVIMANYPIDGDPNDPATVPTAYVYLMDSPRSNNSLVQDVVQEARRQDVAISAPLFDSLGNNLSATCNGGESVIIWDTGCMSASEFTALTGDSTFIQGSLVVPAWRSVNFDSRILMRFPQPEGTGASTMLTELEMGDPLADCETNAASRISVPSDSGGETELCGAMNDDIAQTDAALADRRRDILNARNLEAGTYIAYRQTGNDVVYQPGTMARTNKSADEATTFNVVGDLTATGDMKAFNGDITLADRITVDRNITVPTNAGNTVTANIGGRLSGHTMTSSELDVSSLVSTNARISANEVRATPATQVNSNLVTQMMQMNSSGANISVSNNVDMLGNTNAQTVSVIGNAGPYSLTAGELNARNIQIGANVSATESVFLGSTANTNRVDVNNAAGSAQCRGDCPERTEAGIEDGAL